MKNQQTFTFIDGNFSSHESGEILRNVFSGKIQFHQMKNFSSQERFGTDDETASKRIPQLKKSLEKILEMIAVSKQEDCRLEIKSEITIRFIQPSNDV